jgi:hypothetical protein
MISLYGSALAAFTVISYVVVVMWLVAGGGDAVQIIGRLSVETGDRQVRRQRGVKSVNDGDHAATLPLPLDARRSGEGAPDLPAIRWVYTAVRTRWAGRRGSLCRGQVVTSRRTKLMLAAVSATAA